MWRLIRIGARLAVIAAGFLVLYPLQRLALWQRSRLAGRLPVVFHRLILACLGVRIAIEGTPSPTRPLLLASNHVSWLDIALLGSLFPISFIAKSEVGGWPVIGLFARLQQTIFIERQRRHATGAATGEIGRRLAAGDCLVLFAEGTSSDGNRVLPFRSSLLGGVRQALLAASSRPAIAVQPVAIAYRGYRGIAMNRARRPAYAWYGDMELADHLANVVDDGVIDITIVFGTVIELSAGDDRKNAANRLELESRAMLHRALHGRPA